MDVNPPAFPGPNGAALEVNLSPVSYTHLYLATFEATKKWTMPIRNWGQVYGELSIMYEGRLPE